ncbi:CDP-glucose 4,6-dehydratase [Alteromonas australica]|jgi:CDP-glucose 4,6-dehydratase|uniref:CDP-glucose 4,6-dehydratase n=1 Tax=Alteromonas australica TaxID=589873 RepID=UPI002356871E|nr:CDP-glucose 4,6-dehydratase [Alteromonas australica]|tara:strand:+ start:2704 stop:3783 length:1080 start_codon:yes stop_codon:yes gene_type:complete
MEDMVNDKQFWKNKNVLVTGHTGFKGSWLCLWLQELGANVTGISLRPTCQPNLFEAAAVDENMRSLYIDIRNVDALKKAFSETQPEIIIHMAAQSLVRKSYHDPVETYSTNVMGTVNVLEAVRYSPSVRAVVNVTSDKCYENNDDFRPFVESDRMGGYDPYSNSKGCAELVAQAFTSSYFNKHQFHEHSVAIASARAGNVIGGGDWAQDRLIPDIFKAISKKETVIIRSPKAIRPWQHVLEPLSGYMLLAQRLFEDGANFIGGWNFGPEKQDAKPVAWVVDEICRLWGNEARYEITKNPQPHEANILMLDSSKSNQKLNWKPTWGLSTALKNTVDWYQAYQRQDNMRDVTRKQIVNFRK